MSGVESPDRFGLDEMEDWGQWVLVRGLPELPSELHNDEVVPIARWAGPEYGAVLYVSRYYDEEEADIVVDADIQTYRRVGTAWVPSEGSGGGGWFEEPLVAPAMRDDEAVVFHFHSSGGPGFFCYAAYGVAGRAGAFVEVETADETLSAPLDSPVGAFVVAAGGTAPARVRVLSADGRVLTEEVFSPVDAT